MQLGEQRMSITLNPETQRLIEERMKQTGLSTPDELVRIALQTLDQIRGEDFEELDPQTQAAIDEAEAQHERGEGRPWEQVREEIRARFIK
jgi:Arc/MetJ-type ribon-helix-helix transcriptional regulator